jgi:hypothetical protein
MSARHVKGYSIHGIRESKIACIAARSGALRSLQTVHLALHFVWQLEFQSDCGKIRPRPIGGFRNSLPRQQSTAPLSEWQQLPKALAPFLLVWRGKRNCDGFSVTLKSTALGKNPSMNSHHAFHRPW